MFSSFIVPDGSLRPFDVHLLYDGEPASMLVLAKSHCHAVQVMLRYFKLTGDLNHVIYDSSNDKCFVSDLPFFSDSIYKATLKKFKDGNSK